MSAAMSGQGESALEPPGKSQNARLCRTTAILLRTDLNERSYSRTLLWGHACPEWLMMKALPGGSEGGYDSRASLFTRNVAVIPNGIDALHRTADD